MKKIKILAIIPARGGSKGLPGKNVKILGDMPLIAWTIKAALNCNSITKTIVSTDCEEIAKISENYGAEVPFIRPNELGTDTATTADVVEHAIDSLDEKFDLIILLQPTSPFRTTNDIQRALKLYQTAKVKSVVSVCRTDKSPYWYFWKNEDDSLRAVLKIDTQYSRRQVLEPAYSLNGAIYIVNISDFRSHQIFVFRDSLAYVMDKKSSIDIDDQIDFNLAQLLIGAK